MIERDQVKVDILRVSDLITNVDFAVIDGRETIYINHKPSNRKHSSYYHCVHISSEGLMVNSNGHHSLDVHNAMNEAVKVARKALGV